MFRRELMFRGELMFQRRKGWDLMMENGVFKFPQGCSNSMRLTQGLVLRNHFELKGMLKMRIVLKMCSGSFQLVKTPIHSLTHGVVSAPHTLGIRACFNRYFTVSRIRNCYSPQSFQSYVLLSFFFHRARGQMFCCKICSKPQHLVSLQDLS